MAIFFHVQLLKVVLNCPQLKFEFEFFFIHSYLRDNSLVKCTVVAQILCAIFQGVSKTQTSKTQTSDPKNSDPRVSRKLRPRKNSDPRVSRKLRPEKLRPLDVSKTQTRKTQTLWVSRKLRPKNKTYLHRVNAASRLVYCSLIQWH